MSNSSAESLFSSHDLDGMSLAGAFKKYVLGDSELKGLVSSLKQVSGGELDAREMSHFVHGCLGIDGLGLPVTYSGWDGKAGGFLSPANSLYGPGGRERIALGRRAWAVLGERISRIVGFLKDGDLVAWGDLPVQDGNVYEIRSLLWERRDIIVDFKNGDMRKGEIIKQVMYGVTLSDHAEIVYQALELHLPGWTPGSSRDGRSPSFMNVKVAITQGLNNAGIGDIITYFTTADLKNEFIDEHKLEELTGKEVVNIRRVLNKMISDEKEGRNAGVLPE